MTNQVNNQSLIQSTDVIQLTLTPKMTTAQVAETSVTVNNNSPIQDYVRPDDHTQPTYEMCLEFTMMMMMLMTCIVAAVAALPGNESLSKQLHKRPLAILLMLL